MAWFLFIFTLTLTFSLLFLYKQRQAKLSQAPPNVSSANQKALRKRKKQALIKLLEEVKEENSKKSQSIKKPFIISNDDEEDDKTHHQSQSKSKKELLTTKDTSVQNDSTNQNPLIKTLPPPLSKMELKKYHDKNAILYDQYLSSVRQLKQMKIDRTRKILQGNSFATRNDYSSDSGEDQDSISHPSFMNSDIDVRDIERMLKSHISRIKDEIKSLKGPINNSYVPPPNNKMIGNLIDNSLKSNIKSKPDDEWQKVKGPSKRHTQSPSKVQGGTKPKIDPDQFEYEPITSTTTDDPYAWTQVLPPQSNNIQKTNKNTKRKTKSQPQGPPIPGLTYI